MSTSTLSLSRHRYVRGAFLSLCVDLSNEEYIDGYDPDELSWFIKRNVIFEVPEDDEEALEYVEDW